MKLTVDFEHNETMTNIGFAKALVDCKFFTPFDLCEISCYLNTYCTARNVEPKCEMPNIEEGGAE